MSTPPEGAQLSPDGQYWWDGNEWQPTGGDAAGSSGSAAAAAGSGAGGSGAPAAPPEVVLIGVAGFDPTFPVVGQPIVYTWSEENIGGPITEPYHAKVEFKDPDGNILNADAIMVECAPLDTNGQATRTTTLPAPTKATIGYSIELWADVDHNTNFSEGLNYAYHNVDASDPT
jgi:hypothetical protein